MTEDQIVYKVRALMQVEVDALRAFDEAMRVIDHAATCARLASFRADHLQHLRDLIHGTQVEIGVTLDVPAPDPDSVVTVGRADDTRKALCALRISKWVTLRVYDDAAARGLPGALREAAVRHRRDEARHLAWLDQALATRSWEHESPVPDAAA
jgi:hypothetical protein